MAISNNTIAYQLGMPWIPDCDTERERISYNSM